MGSCTHGQINRLGCLLLSKEGGKQMKLCIQPPLFSAAWSSVSGVGISQDCSQHPNLPSLGQAESPDSEFFNSQLLGHLP